ncbi:2-oxo acid dehydrogenase subunit E2, partial [Bacillus sp. HC-TM]
NLLPNGFRAVIPANTTMTLDLKKDGTAVIDFSKEMKNYAKEEERQIVESIAWTLTQFTEIKQVQFQINGEKLAKMPVGGTPLGEGVSRANGINFDDEQVADVTNTKPVTLYFMAQKARAGSLSSDDMHGTTFTISNLGSFGIEYFTPVLNTPETGILGIGAIEHVPVYKGNILPFFNFFPLYT